MTRLKTGVFALLFLLALFAGQVAAPDGLTTPLTTPCPSVTPTPQPTTGADLPKIPMPTITLVTPQPPRATPVPECEWTCKLTPIGAPSMEITAKDQYGTPTAVKDTTAYMCQVASSTETCTKTQLDSACKPISDPSSSYRSSPVVEASGKVNVLFTIVSSVKCGDKITLGPPIQKLFSDCSAARRAWDAAKQETAKACDPAAIKAREAKCTAQKEAVDQAKKDLDDLQKTIDWEKSSLTFEKQKLEQMQARVSELQTEITKLQADVDKKKTIWIEAEKDVQNYRTASTGAWVEGIVGNAGPIGAIYSVLTLLGGDWGQALGFIPYVGDYINLGQAGMSVEEAQAKVKAAEAAAARAQEAYYAAVAYMKATGVEAALKDYQTRMIPQTEAKITELEKNIKEHEASLQVKTDAYNSAVAEYQKCTGSECEAAKEKENEAKQKYLSCSS